MLFALAWHGASIAGVLSAASLMLTQRPGNAALSI